LIGFVSTKHLIQIKSYWCWPQIDYVNALLVNHAIAHNHNQY